MTQWYHFLNCPAIAAQDAVATSLETVQLDPYYFGYEVGGLIMTLLVDLGTAKPEAATSDAYSCFQKFSRVGPASPGSFTIQIGSLTCSSTEGLSAPHELWLLLCRTVIAMPHIF